MFFNAKEGLRWRKLLVNMALSVLYEKLVGIINHASFSGQCGPGALVLKRKEEKTKQGMNNSFC